jgi:hypothetical protein
MSRQRHIPSDIQYQLLLSFLGLLLVAALAVFPPLVTENVSWRKIIIGSIFNSICVLGILAVFSPSKCGKIVKLKNRTVSSDAVQLASHGTSGALQGHHPTCGNYDSHTIRIKDKTGCAACVGLFIGGLLALVGASAYFFADYPVADHDLLTVLLGVVGVSFGLFQFKFRSFVRLFMNTVFVLGALLVLVGVDGLVQSLFFDFFVICLVVFWLFTRIRLSQWDHERICSGCDVENCDFRV